MEHERQKDCNGEEWQELCSIVENSSSLKEMMEGWVLGRKKSLSIYPGYSDEEDIHTSVCLVFKDLDRELSYLYYPLDKAKKEFKEPKLISKYVLSIDPERHSINFDKNALDKRDDFFNVKYHNDLVGNLGQSSNMFEHLSHCFLEDESSISIGWMHESPSWEDWKDTVDFKEGSLLTAHLHCQFTSLAVNKGLIPGFGQSYYYLNQ